MEIKMTVGKNFTETEKGVFYHERTEARAVELSDERALFEAVWFTVKVSGTQIQLSYEQETGSFVLKGTIDDVRQRTIVDENTVRGWVLSYLVHELGVVPSVEFINKVYNYVLMRAATDAAYWNGSQLYRKFFEGSNREGILGPDPVNELVSRMNVDFFSDKLTP